MVHAASGALERRVRQLPAYELIRELRPGRLIGRRACAARSFRPGIAPAEGEEGDGKSGEQGGAHCDSFGRFIRVYSANGGEVPTSFQVRRRRREGHRVAALRKEGVLGITGRTKR
jgi:hypothetical protein